MPFPSTSLYPSTTLYPGTSGGNSFSSDFTAAATLTSVLHRTIASSFTASATLTSSLHRNIASSFTGSGTLTSTLGRINRIKNPSFESGTKYAWNGTVDSGATAIDTTTAYAGSNSLKATATGSNLVVRGSFTSGQLDEMSPIEVGKLYNLSVYLKPSATISVLVQAWGANSSGAATTGYTGTTQTINAGVWTRVNTAFLAVSGDAYAYPRIVVASSTNGFTLNIDAALLQRGNGLRAYFDGSSSASGFAYAWTGTPHESMSTETHGPTTITSNFSGSGTLTSVLTNWARINSSFSGSATLTSVLHRHIASSFTPTATFSAEISVPRTNLFTYPSAEGAGITWSSTVGTKVMDRSSSEAWVGAESYRLTAWGTTAQEIRTPSGTSGFPVTEGEDLSFSFYTLAGSDVRDVTGKITWYTSGGTSIQTDSGSAEANSTSDWTRYGMTVEAPATAAFAAVHVRFSAMAVEEVQYIDGLLFEQSSTIKAYFDGSTVNTGFTYAWTGTPNASTSTEVAGEPPVALDSDFTASATLTSVLAYNKYLDSAFSASATLTSVLAQGDQIVSHFSTEAVLYSELFYTPQPTPLESLPLSKLVSFNVSTSAVPLNPAEGSGSTPSVNAAYIKGIDPEFMLGETNVLSHGAVGVYEGEVVRLSLPEGSDVASISQDTPLTLLNNDLNLFPFIDAAPSLWTAARAIDYWTQQCGLFLDKVPGDVIAYASGSGHTDSYGAGTTARFYERLEGGTTATTVVSSRSVKTFGSAVTGTTAFHELEDGSVPVSVPTHRKLVASIGLGLRGTGRTATVTWNMLDSQDATHTISISATSEGVITASIAGVPVTSASVAGNADYRISFSIERVSTTSVVGKLTVHTDDLDGTGTLEFESASAGYSYTFPTVLNLTSITHVSAGGSGAEMLRWGTYLTVAKAHPMELPAVQKTLSQTTKEFGFVSGFEGNVWAMLNEFCAIARLDVSFLDSRMLVAPRATAFVPKGRLSRFTYEAELREKYKQVAVVNKRSRAVSTDDAVLWRADSVFQVAAREVFETTVQTGHSILNVVQPVAVDGILPFPYTVGGGQYVVTGADGYIVAPEWWNDNGGKVEVSLTGTQGEIAIKITAPATDTVRAPYRISEGAADRPALYISGSGILNDPLEVHVGTGAKNAKEGFDNVFESPFIAGVRETYDTAARMAAEYSTSNADVSFELPNDFYTPSRFGQYPAGTRFTDGVRNYRIMDASQTHSRVSGNAVPNTTIGDYVASYPEGATIADELARHAGRTIKQFNIKPLRGTDA